MGCIKQLHHLTICKIVGLFLPALPLPAFIPVQQVGVNHRNTQLRGLFHSSRLSYNHLNGSKANINILIKQIFFIFFNKVFTKNIVLLK